MPKIGDLRLPSRFWVKVAESPGPLPTPCWKWTAAHNKDGYGIILWEGRSRLAHTISYQLIGLVPLGEELDHLCRRRDCVNPTHLEAVTHRVNAQRGTADYGGVATARRNQTHCKNDHEFTPENTIIRKNGTRRCRTCVNETWRRRYHDKKGA